MTSTKSVSQGHRGGTRGAMGVQSTTMRKRESDEGRFTVKEGKESPRKPFCKEDHAIEMRIGYSFTHPEWAPFTERHLASQHTQVGIHTDSD